MFGWLYTQSTSGEKLEILFIVIIAAVFKWPNYIVYVHAVIPGSHSAQFDNKLLLMSILYKITIFRRLIMSLKNTVV